MVIDQNLFVIRLLEAVTGGKASPFDRDLCYACECISYTYAKLGDTDNAVDYFRCALNHAARFDEIETMTYTHLPQFSMLDETGLDFYPHGSGSLAAMTAARIWTTRSARSCSMSLHLLCRSWPTGAPYLSTKSKASALDSVLELSHKEGAEGARTPSAPEMGFAP